MSLRGDGILLYDKPAGITSHDVVARVRRAAGRGVKVGHAGTLDPFATGLLLVLLGRATRVQRFLMGLPKAYEATARFGAVSSTGDPEGEIARTGAVPSCELTLPTGRLLQRPHRYSAVKVGGRRAYTLARAGVDVELSEREIDVYRFEELERAGDRRRYLIECSSGTYVRSLIADLGDAYCERLRRTRIGPFDVAEADPERLLGLDQALAFMPEVRLADPDQARRASHGAAIPADAIAGVAAEAMPPGAIAGVALPTGGTGPVRLTDENGLIAVAEPDSEGALLKPVVGFRG